MDSAGVCCGMPHFFRKSQEKLAKAQRKLKAKQPHSANYRKQQKKIAGIARKTADQRKDFLHKKSAEIANQYDLVCVEDLNMRAAANRLESVWIALRAIIIPPSAEKGAYNKSGGIIYDTAAFALTPKIC